MYELRTYQREAVNSLFDYFAEHDGNPILSLPTGSGKSLIQAAFIMETLERTCGPDGYNCTLAVHGGMSDEVDDVLHIEAEDES